MIMGILTGFCEAEDRAVHCFVRGGTYVDEEGNSFRAYAVYQNGKIVQTIPVSAKAISQAFAAVREATCHYSNPLRVEEVHIYSTGAVVVEAGTYGLLPPDNSEPEPEDTDDEFQ